MEKIFYCEGRIGPLLREVFVSILRSQRSHQSSEATREEHGSPDPVLRDPGLQQRNVLSAGLTLGLQSGVDTDGNQAVDTRDHDGPGPWEGHQSAHCSDGPQPSSRGERVSQVCTGQDGSQGCRDNDGAAGTEDVGEEWGGNADWLWVKAWDDILRGTEAVAGCGEGQRDGHELCREDGLRGVHFELVR